MYKLKMIKNRIIAVLLCVILLSNLGLSYALASSATANNFSCAISSPSLGVTQEVDDGIIVATLAAGEDDMILGDETFSVTPSATKICRVTLTGFVTANSIEKNVKFVVTTGGRHVRLAARYHEGMYDILTEDTSGGSTTIDFIMQEGQTYNFNIKDIVLSDAILKIEQHDLPRGEMAMTNIPADAVSAKVNYDNEGMAHALESTDDFKVIEYDRDTINAYIRDGVEAFDNIKDGGYLEGILADIIIALGTIFLRIVEFFLNPNVELTMDNIIFNRLSQTVIDLTPLGGISINDTGKGIFQVSEGKVGQAIDVLYNGLKKLTLAIYIIMLLYIGVRIVSESGGSNQKKFLKYLEYWVGGLVILSIFPYFIPAIPAINNHLVEMLENEAKKLNATYSTEEVLAMLGYDEAYLGEDAEIVNLTQLIQDRIDDLNSQLDGSHATREEAQGAIDRERDHAIGQLTQLNGDSEELRTKLDTVIGIVDSNSSEWTNENQRNYEAAVQDVRKYIFENSNATSGVRNEVKNSLPASLDNQPFVNRQIESIMDYITANAADWKNQKVGYNKKMNTLEHIMENRGLSEDYQECVDLLGDMVKKYEDFAKTQQFQNVDDLMSRYHDNVIQMEITELQKLKDELENDVMLVLKEKAQQDNRVVYAIAWAILMFQMFAVLFLYYKRVIVVVILIIIFPLIMAFYAFDKMGDGKAQSLSTWLKEFISATLMNFLHAVLYIVLINAGVQICNIDPENNWLFLILTVCCLFPAERIMRNVLGLGSSVLGGLKNNFKMAAAGVAVTAGLARSGARYIDKTARELKANQGNIAKMLKKKHEKEKVAEQKREDKAKQMRKRAAIIREKKRRERNKRIDGHTNTKIDTFMKKVDDVGLKINGWKQGSGAGVMKFAKDSAGLVKNTYRTGKKIAKTGYNTARKGVGLAVGAVEGMESFGKEGFASGLTTAQSVAKSVGGFSSVKPVQSDPQRITPAQSRYQDGQKVSGLSSVTPGNIPDSSNTSSSISGINSSSNSSSNNTRTNVNDAKTEVKQHIKHVRNDNT